MPGQQHVEMAGRANRLLARIPFGRADFQEKPRTENPKVFGIEGNHGLPQGGGEMKKAKLRVGQVVRDKAINGRYAKISEFNGKYVTLIADTMSYQVPIIHVRPLTADERGPGDAV